MHSQPTNVVLIVADDPDSAASMQTILGDAEIASVVAADAADAHRRIAAGNVALVVCDAQTQPADGSTLLRKIRHEHPMLPVVLTATDASVEHAVRAMREGANDYLVKPFDAARLLETTRRFLPAAAVGDAALAVDPASVRLFGMARLVAGSDTTVLICGESGTGKEVVARHVHRHSPRAAKPFVAINCAAIPESMLEATLFGHEKGAFTGAAGARAGTFERAQGGTLLLDEISEMALPLQAKLLRVLQEREVERIGGQHPIALDVRVLATTNRNLAETVANGGFREDLYYRLNVFPLHVPALRERRGDILPLARHFLATHAQRMRLPTPELSDAVAHNLLAHRWPGNVRELDNLMQRALILAGGASINADALPLAPARDGIPTPTATESPHALAQTLRDNEESLILDALRENRGSRRKTAVQLGVSERTLRYKLARLREQGRLAAMAS